MKIFFLPVIFLFCFAASTAQQSLRDSSISIFMICPSFAYQIPGADLAKRYGNNLNIGGSFNYKSKTNWLIGFEGFFIFGDDIRETGIFDSISTNQGYIIGTGGKYADIRTYERGYQFNLKIGKIIPTWGPNENSGILLTGAAGFLQHKIRIENATNDAPQLSGAYLAGYDRRTNGLALTEFAGYQYLSNKNRVNFFAGFEFVQAFTQNRRSYNFDTMMQDNTKRFDTLNGLRVGWVFAIFKRKPRDYYFN